MRTFIAFELPEEIKSGLARLQEEIKVSGADVKWIRPENLHLTLKFIGKASEEQAEKITLMIQEAAGKNSPFMMQIATIGAFPKIDFPRVIWAGLDKGDAEAKKIAAELEKETQMLGIAKEERKFSSHITIGRVRSGKNRLKLVKILKELTDKPRERFPEVNIGRITLFKSTLTPQGALYESLSEATLKTT